MERRAFIKKMGMSAFALSSASVPASCLKINKKNKPPNFIVILADDLGFSDLGCYGGEINTPHIDSLAENGLRFTQAYNCARCSPTRASLLTGRYAHQVNLAKNGQSLAKYSRTIAEALKPAGYHTAMAGKWHLSEDRQLDMENHLKWLNHHIDPGIPFAPLETYPINRGFDEFYGVIWGVIDFFDPFSLIEGKEAVTEVKNDYYFTDAITDKSSEYIHKFAGDDEPFFLYLAHTAPHWPLHAPEANIRKYKDMYLEGWDALREQRFARQLKMGLFEQGKIQLPAMDAEQKWDDLDTTEQEFLAGKMQVHAAMIERMDEGIGRIIQSLKETGQIDNTIIFFLSDNGSSPEVPNWPPGYDRPSHTRDGRKMLRDKELRQKPQIVGSEESYTGIGRAWANATNTPFRYWKKESYEGGNHTPLIIHWPDGLKRKQGSFCNEPTHVMDIMPTCLEIAGVRPRESLEESAMPPIEGISLLPVLRNSNRAGHKAIFFEHERGRAMRSGDWKIVATAKAPGEWKLYNLADDPTEIVDLSDRFPDKKAAMIQSWEEWYERMSVGRDEKF